MRKELSTVALLQARLDQGLDYIELFVPFALGAVEQLGSDDGFRVEELQGQILEQFVLHIPVDTCRVLLTRAKKKNAVWRKGGRYFRDETFDFSRYRFTTEVSRLEDQYSRIGDRFARFLAYEYQEEMGADQALSLLVSFLQDKQVPLLLGKDLDATLNRIKVEEGESRRTARFVLNDCSASPETRLQLNGLLQGIVTKQAILLQEVTGAKESFTRLRAYLDTNVLLGALGLEGQTIETAQRAFIDLLREAGISLYVFQRTLVEIRGILNRMAEFVATPEGIRRLRQTDLTRELRRKRTRPSELRQQAALLEQTVRNKLGVRIEEYPDRNAEYTEDETSLAQALKDPARPGDPLQDPRVIHDVDSVAAILTIRRGASVSRLDDARAIFVTQASEVARNTRRWWSDQGFSGIPPIVHQYWISNLVWLKARGARSKIGDYQAGALEALCEVALRPRAKTWGLFLTTLDDLVSSGSLLSDQSITLLCSDLADSSLSRLEDDLVDEITESDAYSIREVIDRVQQSQEAKAAELRSSLSEEQSRTARLEASLQDTATVVARWIARPVLVLTFLLIVAATVVGGGFLGAGPIPTAILIAVLVMATIGNLVWGLYLTALVERMEAAIAEKIKRAMLHRGETRS